MDDEYIRYEKLLRRIPSLPSLPSLDSEPVGGTPALCPDQLLLGVGDTRHQLFHESEATRSQKAELALFSGVEEKIRNYSPWQLVAPTLDKSIIQDLPRIVQKLLENGIDSRAALHWAISVKDVSGETLEEILLAGADANSVFREDGETALHIVTQEEDFETFKTKAEILFKFGANPNALDYFERTVLHYSAMLNRRDKISCLIKNGANVNFVGKTGITALMSACLYGSKDAFYELMKSKAEINIVDSEGHSALGILCLYNHEPWMLKRLLEAGADPNCGGGSCLYPLQAAAKYTCPKFGYCRLLIDAGADALAEGGRYFNALQAAVANPPLDGTETDIVKLLLEAGVPVNARDIYTDMTALRMAVMHGNKKFVSTLLSAGADVHCTYSQAERPKTMTILGFAVLEGTVEIVNMLIQHGASLNTTTFYGETILVYSTSYHSPKIMSLLLQAGSNPNVTGISGTTPLHAAAESNDLSKVQLLLEKGANIHASSNDLGTVLHYVARHTSYRWDEAARVTAFLLERGAELRATDKDGLLALHLAARKDEYQPILRVLLDATGGNETARLSDGLGRTPLHQAAEYGALQNLTELLNSKARIDINARDSSGCTPLHLAAKSGHKQVVVNLLSHGADLRIKDRTRKKALQYAIENNRFQISQILESSEITRKKGLYSFQNIYLCAVFILLFAVIWNRW